MLINLTKYRIFKSKEITVLSVVFVKRAQQHVRAKFIYQTYIPGMVAVGKNINHDNVLIF